MFKSDCLGCRVVALTMIQVILSVVLFKATRMGKSSSISHDAWCKIYAEWMMKNSQEWVNRYLARLRGEAT